MSSKKASKPSKIVATQLIKTLPEDRFDRDGWVSADTLTRMQAILNRVYSAKSESMDAAGFAAMNWALQIQNMKMPYELPIDWYLKGRKWWHAGMAEWLCANGTIQLGASLRSQLFNALCHWNENPASWMSRLLHDIHAIDLALTGLSKAEDLITDSLFKHTGLEHASLENVRLTVRERLVKYAQKVIDRRSPVLLYLDSSLIRYDGISPERLIYADAEDYLNAPAPDSLPGIEYLF